jgi:hypothetical protein
MKSRIAKQPLVGSYSNLKLKLMGSNQNCTKVWNEDNLQWKMTSNGRWPQYIKSWISQQPLVGSCSNLKLKLMGSNQSVQSYETKTTSKGSQPQMKDDFKILKVELLKVE